MIKNWFIINPHFEIGIDYFLQSYQWGNVLCVDITNVFKFMDIHNLIVLNYVLDSFGDIYEGKHIFFNFKQNIYRIR